ncbi:MAG: ATP-binding protein [Proteobacteria bacterium]|nr:ATP-binding protein [Pseudomonadota bacterium]
MVFLGGPRQVGKTTLSLLVLNQKIPFRGKLPQAYINWDVIPDKEVLTLGKLPGNEALIVFDEIHKYAHWRNLIKGFYDRHHPHISFLVTGSARLDYYAKGGDSLQGRYHYYRLHPLTLGEISSDYHPGGLKTLLEFGGFPEPFLAQSKRSHRRWHRERMSRVIHEDLRNLEHIQEISLMEVLIDALPKRVGSPLSLNSLRENLHVSHETVTRWIQIIESMYIGFSVMPYGSEKIRAIKKERKFYLWDWSACENDGAKFENMVASHLLKYCHLMEDWEGYPMELRYIRNRAGKEIDFIVLKERTPLFAVECKLQESSVSPSVKFFSERLPEVPNFYQVHTGTSDYLSEKKIRVLPFATLCKELSLP